MRVASFIEVPYADDEGTCTFRMIPPNRAMSALASATVALVQAKITAAEQRLGRPLSAEEEAETLSAVEVGPDDIGFLNRDLFLAFIDAFSEGVIDWQGVADEDGNPRACTHEQKQLVPWEVQVAVVMGYMMRRQGLEAKKASPSATPTRP